MRYFPTLLLMTLAVLSACEDDGSGSAAGGGESNGGEGGEAGTSTGGGSRNDGGQAEPSGGGSEQQAAGADRGGSASGSSSAGTSSTPTTLYVPPAEIIGGACEGTPTPATPPCTFEAEQVYCRKDDPSQVIMAVCSAAGRSQCEVMDECEPGWHACTASDYVARGGRDIAPSFSSATDRAWLAACVRDVSGLQLRNQPCSVCGQDVGFPPSIQWWCDGSVVYEGGMEGDTLGVVAAPECMRVGSNAPGFGAFWTMSFSDGAPSFVMCCSDSP